MRPFFEVSGLNVYLQIAVTLISISIHLIRTRKGERNESTVEIISIYTIGLAGWFGIMSGLFGHIIYADEVATGIGWPIQSGFQMELGFASIGIGLIGFLGFWIRSFWLPFIIVKSSFMWGAGLTHILHMIQHNNFSASNTGIIVYWDFILPILLIYLYIRYQKEQRFKKRSLE
jgi:hypothetical protein